MEFLKSKPGHDPIVVEGYFPVSQERAFHSWTDPDMIMKWFGRAPNSLHSATIDLRPGGAWRFLKSDDGEQMVGFEGEYVEIEPMERLKFTWAQIQIFHAGGREATPFSQVEVFFQRSGEGTLIKVVHSAIDSEEKCAGFGAGWNMAFGNMQGLFNS